MRGASTALVGLAALALGVLCPRACADDPPPPTFSEAVRAFEAERGSAILVRARALRLLAAYKTSDCVDYLDAVRQGATPGSKGLEILALRLIGDVGVEPAPAILGKLVREGAPSERPTAIRAYACLKPAPAPEPILAVMADSKAHPELRLAATEACAVYPTVASAKALADQLQEQRPEGRLLNATCAALRRVLGRPEPDAWFTGVIGQGSYGRAQPALLRVAGACGDPKLIPKLIEALAERRREVRIEAATSLGERLADAKPGTTAVAQGALAGLLASKFEDERVAAARSLGRIGPDEERTALLVTCLGDDRPDVRTVTVRALERSADPKAQAGVRASLADKSRSVQHAAVEALSLQRTVEAVGALFAALPKAEGRFEAELLTSLRALTGANMGEEKRDWLAWWESARANYVLPPPDAKGPEKKLATKARKRPGYWGQSIVSERVAFLVDTSGSMVAERRMEGSTVVVTRMIVARHELKRVIEELPGRARFNVVPFASEPAPWKKRAERATKRNKEKAEEFVDGLVARGGTNIHDALMLALDDTRIDTIWLLTDGEPTEGLVVDPEELLREVRLRNGTRRVAIHTLAVGLKSKFLERLAAENGGRHYVR